ncbi:MAG: hypothetical protein U0164_17380 [Gemmatimonadaceae bacterium]
MRRWPRGRAALAIASAAAAIAACRGGLRAVGGSSDGPPSGTVIVSNMNDATATLIDAASGRVVATLPTGEGPHEVAVSHDGALAVVTNYGVRGKPGHSITLIDVARAAVARTLDLGAFLRPHGIAFLPGDSLLVVTSEARQAVLLVDVRNGAVVATRATRGRASHMLALSASGERLVVANIADGSVSVIAPFGADSADVFPVAGAVEGIAITPDGRHAWVGSNRDSLVVVVDLATRAPLDSLRGFGMPYRLAVSPDGRSVVISDPVRGEVRAFDALSRRPRWTLAVPRDSLVATAEVPGSPSPEGVAIARDSRWAFVTLQGRNRLATIDLAQGRIVRLTPTGTWSDGVAYSPVAGNR